MKLKKEAAANEKVRTCGKVQQVYLVLGQGVAASFGKFVSGDVNKTNCCVC